MAPVDFVSEAFFRNPGAAVATLRASGPAVATRFPMVGKVWVTTTHEATARVLKDSSTFTLRKEGGAVAGIRWWMPRLVQTLASNMLTTDEPDHTRLRSIVDEAFRRSERPTPAATKHRVAPVFSPWHAPAGSPGPHCLLPRNAASNACGLCAQG